MNTDIYIKTLKQYFGYDSFRSIQLDIVKSIAEGHDTLGLMPTGGGKSITFQVPALMMDGVCIVFTPLISLMKDQVEHLKRKGIKAEAIHSGMTHNEIQRVLDNAIYGGLKFLYISPERLSSSLFIAKLFYMDVCFITVDEAHCISQWGYDFRPSYLKLGELRKLKTDAPVLALTATATPLVAKDIQEKLSFGKLSDKEPKFYKMSFARKNLSYVVRYTEDKIGDMVHILNSVQGSAIVYTRSRKKTHDVAKLLESNGLSTTYYHAGLDFSIKDSHQLSWQNDKYRIIVATNAFGMGIDKPDVRIVIHLDCPDSIEAYFQEAGRAGRDGNRSYAVLLYNKQDRQKLQRQLAASFPPKEYIYRVYEDLANSFQLAEESGEGARYEFDLERFCLNFKHFPSRVEGALNILQNAGFMQYEKEPDSQPRVQFLIGRDELYDIRGLSPLEDDVLTALLRCYGSLFSELTFINESTVSAYCHIDERHLYNALISLAQRRILRFVPRKDTPLITYLQQRVPVKRLHIPEEVYETMQQRMEERISAMIAYAETEDECRSVMLLKYFGDNNSTPCKCCDVCLSSKMFDTTDARSIIRDRLSDGKRHLVTEIKEWGLDSQTLQSALERMMEDDEIIYSPPFISIGN